MIAHLIHLVHNKRFNLFVLFNNAGIGTGGPIATASFDEIDRTVAINFTGVLNGARIGHDRIIDTMMMDGLEDAYEPGKAMGVFAEEAVRDYQFSRADQDDYAIRSLSRANEAIASGAFQREITPVTVPGRGGDMLIDTDEQPGKARPDKIPSLRPAFAKDGTITAANASSISDGAAALALLPVVRHLQKARP